MTCIFVQWHIFLLISLNKKSELLTLSWEIINWSSHLSCDWLFAALVLRVIGCLYLAFWNHLTRLGLFGFVSQKLYLQPRVVLCNRPQHSILLYCNYQKRIPTIGKVTSEFELTSGFWFICGKWKTVMLGSVSIFTLLTWDSSPQCLTKAKKKTYPYSSHVWLHACILM